LEPTQQFSITLPLEMAKMVRGKVESGEYASESEVIREGLRSLEMHDQALDAWLCNEAIPALAATKANPSTSRTGEQVRDSLAAAYRSAQKAG